MSENAKSFRHQLSPDVSFDGGSLDCGSGLLLLIRRHIDPLPRGGLLELLSTDSSVETDLPAWCRLTGNALISVAINADHRSYLICKGALAERTSPAPLGLEIQPAQSPLVSVPNSSELPQPAPAPTVRPLAVMGIGSWPRPRWLLTAIHDHIAGRLNEQLFQETANDAVRLCVAAQMRAGVDVITDGEQRRDSYASFVGGILDNCQLVPITDLLPYVENPEEFARELQALDVPAAEVRHPAVLGPLRRSRPLTVHEFEFLRRLTDKPVKVALPGPYLLTRTMWLECVAERAYESREQLAADIVRILREELFALLAAGVSLVQLDEPVLSEVVFGTAVGRRSFMCGALSGKRPADEELEFAADLLNRVIAGAPRERTAMHVCRGNWSRNEALALHGSYAPLLDTLRSIRVGTYFLELCTPRAGEWEVLQQLPQDARIGVGMVNPKADRIESVDELTASLARAIRLFGHDRVLVNPDCGFATFADNPVNSAEIAEAKFANLCQAVARVLQCLA